MMVTLENTGNISFYDMYKLFRPDTHLGVDEIKHKDASITIIDISNNRKYNIMGFNLYPTMDEVPKLERTIELEFPTEILKRALARIEDEKTDWLTIGENNKYTMSPQIMNRYNIKYGTQCKTVNGVINNIYKRIHVDYVTEMIDEYNITFDDSNRFRKEIVMSAKDIARFNDDHNTFFKEPGEIMHAIRHDFIAPKKDKTEVVKIYPYGKLCISTLSKIYKSHSDQSTKYRQYKQHYVLACDYSMTPQVVKDKKGRIEYVIETVKKTRTALYQKKTQYNANGLITDIYDYVITSSGYKEHCTHTAYRPSMKEFNEGIKIPTNVSKIITTDSFKGVQTRRTEIEYDKNGRVSREKVYTLNGQMYIELVDKLYQTGKLQSKTERHPNDTNPCDYTYELYDDRGRVVKRKTCDYKGSVETVEILYSIPNALECYEKCSFVTSGAGIRVLNLDTNSYYKWVRMVKDTDTQNIVIYVEPYPDKGKKKDQL